MARVGVLLSGILLTAFLGVSAEAGARGQTSLPGYHVQTSQASSTGLSGANKDLLLQASASHRAQIATTGDRAKSIQGSHEASANLATDGAPLPQTSTILPLLGFIGLGSLVAGLFVRR